MELGDGLLYYLKIVGGVLIFLLLIPVGAYLRGQTYRSVYGNATIGEDIRRLFEKVKQWRQKKNIKLKQKKNGK